MHSPCGLGKFCCLSRFTGAYLHQIAFKIMLLPIHNWRRYSFKPVQLIVKCVHAHVNQTYCCVSWSHLRVFLTWIPSLLCGVSTPNLLSFGILLQSYFLSNISPVKNEGNHLQGGELYNSTWRINPITSRGDYCVTSSYNIYYIIQQMSDKNIQTYQEEVAILI